MTTRASGRARKKLHLPIVGVTNGPGVNAPGGRKPGWLKVRLASGPNYTELKTLMRGSALHTVCEEAQCPNIGECWEEREATFLLLGATCTRRCGFCDVHTGKPGEVDEEEPARLAATVREMSLRHVVITGVARDDLPDGGANVWARAISACHDSVPGIDVEVLPSDFKGGRPNLATVLGAGPAVFAHNLETVVRLHDKIRPAFGYERSLSVLRFAKEHTPGIVTKSNLILGMGERPDEVRQAMIDIRDAGVDLLTMGQYLQPSPRHLPVNRWVTPDEFAEHALEGESLGITHVEAGPLVRSSYHAGRQLGRARAKALSAHR
jgi:lipoic acid synthetase